MARRGDAGGHWGRLGLCLLMLGLMGLSGLFGAARGAPAPSVSEGALSAKTSVRANASGSVSGGLLDTDPAHWRAFAGRMVRDITAKGLSRTRLLRLRHQLDTRIGAPLDAERFSHDVRRVRNLELFQDIRVEVTVEEGSAGGHGVKGRGVEPGGDGKGGDGVVICFYMKDKWSLLPYFNTFFNLGSVSVIAGVYDVNILGFLSYVDLQLQLFSYLPISKDSLRPGGVLSLDLPRLFGRAVGYDLDLRAITSLRTVLTDHRTVGAHLQSERYGGFHSLRYEPWPWLVLGLGQTVIWERYDLAPESLAPTVPMPRTGLTHALSVSARLGYLSYRDFLMHGLRVTLAVEGASDLLGSDFSYVRVSGEARGFWRFGPRGGNLGLWLQGGYMKGGGYGNLYQIGSWTGLRGFYTGQFLARAYMVGTLEYRTGLLAMDFPVMSIIPFFRGKVLRVQGAAFVDLGAVAGAGPWRPRESGERLTSLGAGLRFMVTKIYRAVLRLDFAHVVSPYRSYDFIIATQQYF